MPTRKKITAQPHKTQKASTRSARRTQSSMFDLKTSYGSLFYGVVTIAVIFLIFFMGLKIFSPKTKKTGNITPEAAKTTAIPTSQTIPEIGKTYIVQEGETLWSIAEKAYKSGYNWTDIARANKISDPNAIDKGQKLVIPSVAPRVIAQASVTVSPQQTALSPTAIIRRTSPPIQQGTLAQITASSYTVQHGDDLWDIALRAYRDGYKWVEIARANNLSNPDIIHAGNVLKIPR